MKKFICIFLTLMLSFSVFSEFTVNALSYSDSENIVFGDADSDGKVSLKDVTVIQQSIAGLRMLQHNTAKKCDIDFDDRKAKRNHYGICSPLPSACCSRLSCTRGRDR